MVAGVAIGLDAAMAKVSNNTKAAKFRQQTATALSLWVSQNTQANLFDRLAPRVAASSKAPGRNRRKVSAAEGAQIDALVSEFDGRFHVVCKHLDDAEWAAAFYDGKGTLVDTWDKPLVAASKVGKTPLSIIKQQKKPELVLASKETFDAFAHASSGKLVPQAMFRRGKLFVYVWHFIDIMKLCDPTLLGRRQEAREAIDNDEPEVPSTDYQYGNMRPRNGLDRELIDTICGKMAKHGTPLNYIASLMSISRWELPEWKRKGEAFLKTGEPPEWEIFGRFVDGIDQALGEYADTVCDGATNKDDWKRWIEIGDRRMPETWGKNQPGGGEGTFDPSDKFL